MKVLGYSLMALLIPGSFAVWMFLWPELTHPVWMCLTTLLLTALLVVVAHKKLKSRGVFEDHGLTLLLSFVYLILPVGALILLANRSVPHDPVVTHQVVMDRFPDQPDGARNGWIFLWTGQDIQKIKVTPSDPLYLCSPQDSVALVHVTGALGFEYLDHVDRLQ